MSFDNTGMLGANTWRHVAFIEQTRGGGDWAPRRSIWGSGIPRRRAARPAAWLMSSDVCKHCTHAGCLDVCPTGALFRTEFGTVVVQQDICNGCGYCVSGCPYGVIDRRDGDGRAWKCTLCYDRLHDGLEPACAKACPTESIQFGVLDELRERAAARVEELHERGVPEARLYGHDPNDGVGGDGAFFLLLDEPEVYGLPPDPVVPTRDAAAMWRHAGLRRRRLVAAAVSAFVGAGAAVTRGGRMREQLAVPPAEIPVLLRTRSAQNTGVGMEDRGIPVHRWPVGGFGIAGGRRRPHRAARVAPGEPGRRAGQHRRQHVPAGRRPGPAGAVPPHAAGGQAQFADERGHLDSGGLRAGRRAGRGRGS